MDEQDGAVISECGRYRYALWRDLRRHEQATLDGLPGGRGTVLFVMLNPSTADATADDPTIRRCIGFARRWGFDRLAVGNLYAMRATDPRKLVGADDPIGPNNFTWLRRLAGDAGEVVAAWGVPPTDVPEGFHVARVLGALGPTKVLGLTKEGFPRHPLYLRRDTEPKEWTP